MVEQVTHQVPIICIDDDFGEELETELELNDSQKALLLSNLERLFQNQCFIES